MEKLAIILVAAFCLVSCGMDSSNSKQNAESADATETVQQSAADKVSVLYFHGKQRCITCRAIEKCAREVVAGMNPEQVELRVIDISDDANSEIVEKYEVAWSSLILERGEQSTDLTDMAFRYAKNNPDEFITLLKGEIEKMLE
ncbi:MAG: nitrophenyl compound nitroreductase subunit ArsF family protein [Muribaculaceae bacterium]